MKKSGITEITEIASLSILTGQAVKIYNYLLVIIFFLIFPNLSFANHSFFSDPHDSLSYDGTGEQITITDEECSFRVMVEGTAEAMVKTTVAGGCEDKEGSVYTWERKKVKSGDVIKAGEEIVTGDNGYVKILLPDDSFIIVDKNTKFTPDNNICEQIQSNSRLNFGGVFTKIKKLVGGAKFEVTSENRTAIGVRGTEFVVASTGNSDVVKVYEGSVEVKPPITSKIESKEEQMEKVAKDFEEGRISMEEFTQKMTEFSSEVQEVVDQMVIVVEAGYKLTVYTDGSIVGPEPIEENDDRWFERF